MDEGRPQVEVSEYERQYLLSLDPRYAALEPYLEIHGWLAVNEAVALFELAASLPQDGPRVVEIGAWLGKSSFVLAKGLEGKKDPSLHCIDPFNADGDSLSVDAYHETSERYGRPLLDVFTENMRRLGVDGTIEALPGYSSEVVAGFEERVDRIDMLFIDGNHDHDYVDQDYVDWSPLIQSGGIIAFHDVAQQGTQLGPWRVAKARVLDSDEWTDAALIGSLLFARRV